MHHLFSFILGAPTCKVSLLGQSQDVVTATLPWLGPFLACICGVALCLLFHVKATDSVVSFLSSIMASSLCLLCLQSLLPSWELGLTLRNLPDKTMIFSPSHNLKIYSSLQNTVFVTKGSINSFCYKYRLRGRVHFLVYHTIYFLSRIMLAACRPSNAWI